MAEEGEATPLLRSLARTGQAVDDEEAIIEGRWYEGPLLLAGIKLGLLFFAFVGLVVGTFYFAMPPVDP